jgi:hypothetical protein
MGSLIGEYLMNMEQIEQKLNDAINYQLKALKDIKKHADDINQINKRNAEVIFGLVKSKINTKMQEYVRLQINESDCNPLKPSSCISFSAFGTTGKIKIDYDDKDMFNNLAYYIVKINSLA